MEIIWYLEFIARFSLNLGAASVLMFGLYYRRHHNRDTAVSALLLNVFVFAVLTVLADVQFSLAAGFGLFAILAGTMGAWIRRSRGFLSLERYITGSIFIGLGLTTALSGAGRK